MFLGEVLGHEGVQIAGDLAGGVEYNVFRNLATGKRVCIFTNARMEAVQAGFSGLRG